MSVDKQATQDRIPELDWTADQIDWFWDAFSSTLVAQESYFTKIWGQAITNLFLQAGSLRNVDVLDYGCGPGYLAEQILKHSGSVSGADPSRKSIEAANRRLQDQQNWRGAQLIHDGTAELADRSFGVAFCIETIEHLPDEAVRAVFTDLHRLLNSGGLVMITTPNNEDLRKRMVLCPKCRHQFHRVQHVRSWNSDSLAAELRKHGFEPLFCEGVHLQNFRPQRKRSLRYLCMNDLIDATRQVVRRVADHVDGRSFPNRRTFRRQLMSLEKPHLVAIAQRS